MPYTKTTWINGQTPLSAQNMNKIEDQLEVLDDAAASLASAVDDINEDLATKMSSTNPAFTGIMSGDSYIASGEVGDLTMSAKGDNTRVILKATGAIHLVPKSDSGVRIMAGIGLDMDSRPIYNLPSPGTGSEPVTLDYFNANNFSTIVTSTEAPTGVPEGTIWFQIPAV